MQMRGLVAAALASLVGAGFSAQALAPRDAAPAAAPAPAATEEYFPGSAYYDAVDDTRTGATGTAALPDIAVPDVAVPDGTIQPARPFALAGGGQDKARALTCLTTAIYYEAAREPDAGQRAVAQVVLNRVRHPAFPDTVCGVVYQGSEKRGCQFSFACDGSLARGPPERRYWLRAQQVAAAALAGDVFAPVGLATHYHSYAVTPAWNRALVMTGAFGAHFFHRWKGWWGTPAAFREIYLGHEPVPGPHPAAELAAGAQAAEQPASPAPQPKPADQPAYAASGTPQPAYAAPALPESGILDKWKDSGKPLR